MSEGVQTTSGSWWRNSLLNRLAELRQREDQIFLVLALVIGALTGLAVVAFILLTARRMDPLQARRQVHLPSLVLVLPSAS